MRIEFFPDASEGDVLLIHSNDSRAWTHLREGILRLLKGELDVLHVHALEGVEAWTGAG